MEGGAGDFASSIAFSDSMITTTTTTVTTPCSNSSSTTTNDHDHDHHLSSKGCGSKQVRRRSRASKKTPTTLLNANTTNFRALVQQFTGCPSTPFSFGSSKSKGPVNLSFQQQNQKYDASVMNNNNHFYQQQYQPQKHFQQQEEHHHDQQVAHQDQQSLVSFDYDHNAISGSDDHGFLTNPRSGNYLEIPDGFDTDEISMHEITGGSAFSSEDRNNSYLL
ncbi:hypothetical protein JRO89_XS06G0242000 [Xanthoceras sorbifolium]|uniref:VQ domain-containing protein n=1 Tax=Xanthoceras sorbifolium TaxID=99658 RepID=A0ABQ8HZ81_9ROSI|nr:hypothetical protein JRO89_XS06G0242000 [Xanthoceras sorbifolium]